MACSMWRVGAAAVSSEGVSRQRERERKKIHREIEGDTEMEKDTKREFFSFL